MFQLRVICLTTIFVILLVRVVESSGFGKCPKYPSMPKFDMTKVWVQNYHFSLWIFFPFFYADFPLKLIYGDRFDLMREQQTCGSRMDGQEIFFPHIFMHKVKRYLQAIAASLTRNIQCATFVDYSNRRCVCECVLSLVDWMVRGKVITVQCVHFSLSNASGECPLSNVHCATMDQQSAFTSANRSIFFFLFRVVLMSLGFFRSQDFCLEIWNGKHVNDSRCDSNWCRKCVYCLKSWIHMPKIRKRQQLFVFNAQRSLYLH